MQVWSDPQPDATVQQTPLSCTTAVQDHSVAFSRTHSAWLQLRHAMGQGQTVLGMLCATANSTLRHKPLSTYYEGKGCCSIGSGTGKNTFFCRRIIGNASISRSTAAKPATDLLQPATAHIFFNGVTRPSICASLGHNRSSRTVPIPLLQRTPERYLSKQLSHSPSIAHLPARWQQSMDITAVGVGTILVAGFVCCRERSR